MALIKSIFVILTVIILMPFVLLGFVGYFIKEAIENGLEWASCFGDWLLKDD